MRRDCQSRRGVAESEGYEWVGGAEREGRSWVVRGGGEDDRSVEGEAVRKGEGRLGVDVDAAERSPSPRTF